MCNYHSRFYSLGKESSQTWSITTFAYALNIVPMQFNLIDFVVYVFMRAQTAKPNILFVLLVLLSLSCSIDTLWNFKSVVAYGEVQVSSETLEKVKAGNQASLVSYIN